MVKDVREPWITYDTVLIGPGMAALNRGWFNSFAQMAAANDIPFFNVRNRSVSGPQYNNQDSAEMSSFPFWCYSIGVEFLTFAIGDSCEALRPIILNYAAAAAPGPAGPPFVLESQIQNSVERQVFASMLDHSGIKFRVAQDIKLTNVCIHQPAGFGTDGNARMLGAGQNSLGVLSNYTNGAPHIQNRYKFLNPIEMPRNVNFNCVLEFSNYAKAVLAAMGGPETFWTDNDEEQQTAPTPVAGIRITLLGYRTVQQRGELRN